MGFITTDTMRLLQILEAKHECFIPVYSPKKQKKKKQKQKRRGNNTSNIPVLSVATKSKQNGVLEVSTGLI